MWSPGVVHARLSESLEWMLLDLLDPHKAQALPGDYEQARSRLVSHLLSMEPPLEESRPPPIVFPRGPAADNPDFERRHAPLDESTGRPAPIEDAPAGGTQHEWEEFSYASSFDRLTSRKPKASAQPAPVPMGVHLRSVLAVTAALTVGALVYAALGGGFPGLSAGVRSFLGDQAAKVRLILPGYDVGNLPAGPAPMSPSGAGPTESAHG